MTRGFVYECSIDGLWYCADYADPYSLLEDLATRDVDVRLDGSCVEQTTIRYEENGHTMWTVTRGRKQTITEDVRKMLRASGVSV